MSPIGLPPQDHHEVALARGLERVRARDAEELERLGACAVGGGALEVPCLRWRLRLRLEPFSMAVLPGLERPGVVWQILVLDYLSGGEIGPPRRFVSFADFPQVRAYLRTFEGRVTARLAGTVGAGREQFVRAAEHCGGTRGGEEPLSYLFRFFPRFELQVVRYEGDEDFPASCNVLFPDNAPDILSAESMIVAAEKLVSALRGKGPCD